MDLDDAARADGYRLTSLPETGSTNDDAAEAARRGDPGRHWFVAGRQTTGRGRQGRAWVSEPGNLFASLLLLDACDLRVAPQLGFVAGLSLHDAVSAVTGLEPPRLALKWPNDLLLDGGKLSGLLLEAHRVDQGRSVAFVVGFGVNVANAPTLPPSRVEDRGASPLSHVGEGWGEGEPLSGEALTLATSHGSGEPSALPAHPHPDPSPTRERGTGLVTPYPTANLQAVASGATRERLFQALSAAFPRRLAQWGAGAGFAGIRAEWLARAVGLGGPARVRLPGGDLTGRFVGLDPAGRLQLQAAEGVRVIDAGDLFFPNLTDPTDVRSNLFMRH